MSTRDHHPVSGLPIIKPAAPRPLGVGASPITAHGRVWPPSDSLGSTPCSGGLSPASSTSETVDDLPPLGPEILPEIIPIDPPASLPMKSNLTQKLATLRGNTYPLTSSRTASQQERALGPQAPRALARLPSASPATPGDDEQPPRAPRVFVGDSCSSHPANAQCGLPPLLGAAGSVGPSSVGGSLSPPESPMSHDTLDQRWWGSSCSSSSSVSSEDTPTPMLPLSVLPPPDVERDAVDLPLLVETLWVGGVRVDMRHGVWMPAGKDAGHLIASWDQITKTACSKGQLKTRQLLVLLEQRWLGESVPALDAHMQQTGARGMPVWAEDALELAPLASQPMGIAGATTSAQALDIGKIVPPLALLEPAASPHTAVNRLAALQAWVRDMQPLLFDARQRIDSLQQQVSHQGQCLQAAQGTLDRREAEASNLMQVIKELTQGRTKLVYSRASLQERFTTLQQEYTKSLRVSEVSRQVSKENMGKAARMQRAMRQAEQEVYRTRTQLTSVLQANESLRHRNVLLSQRLALLEGQEGAPRGGGSAVREAWALQRAMLELY